MRLAPASSLGGYEILGLLGAGGIGEVYRARDSRLGREVALKVLPEDLASRPDRLARFEREARTVAALNHPNIVTIHTIEEAGGIRFLTMELVEGQTLASHISPGGLPLARVLEISLALSDALAAAQGRGIVHRDLKPGNVMVTPDGRIKVLDFGLAKFTASEAAAAKEGGAQEHTASMALTAEGQAMGTTPYMAPEQIRGGEVNARSDLFALGIIMYEMASGRRPFVGLTRADVSSSILRDRHHPLTRLRADYPRDLERILDRCLEKSPHDRPGSAREVSGELRALLQRVAAGAVLATGPSQLATIAVLPFVNRSPNLADEFFADGLADELLSVLGKVPGLRVAARSSSFRFKGQTTSADAAGRALKVATVLEGSVRSAGDHVRVAVQLVNVEDGLHLWSETYDRTSNDVLAVQDEIAQAVVRELRAALLGEQADSDAARRAKDDVAAALRGRSRNPDAHRLYLRARQVLLQFNREDMDRAAELMNEALALDPGFAVAWAELGGIYTRQASWGWIPRSAGYQRALDAVERALSIEPDLAEAHSHLGFVRLNGFWDLRGAAESFARALALDANNLRSIASAGTLAACMGRVDEAIQHFRRIVELDPLSASSYNQLGYYLQSAGRLAESETTFRNALELAPQLAGVRALLAYTLLRLERGEEALAEVMREPDPPHRLWGLAIVHSALGHTSESDAALRELIETTGDGNAYYIAEVYAATGKKDEAFVWLERMYEQRDPGMVDMAVSSLLRQLEDDPRWGQFCTKIGIGSVETTGIGTKATTR